MRYEEQVEVEKKKLAGFGNKGEEAIYVLAISCGPRNYSYISRIEEPIELEPGGAQGDVLKAVTHFTQCGKGLYDPDLLGNTIAFMIVQMQ